MVTCFAGFFNGIIYFRPMFQRCRKEFPDDTRVQAFRRSQEQRGYRHCKQGTPHVVAKTTQLSLKKEATKAAMTRAHSVMRRHERDVRLGHVHQRHGTWPVPVAKDTAVLDNKPTKRPSDKQRQRKRHVASQFTAVR